MPMADISRSGHRKNFRPLFEYRIGERDLDLFCTSEKQARYRERDLGVDGEKAASGSLSTLALEQKWDALHAIEVIQ
jgi:hypothetical protein